MLLLQMVIFEITESKPLIFTGKYMRASLLILAAIFLSILAGLAGEVTLAEGDISTSSQLLCLSIPCHLSSRSLGAWVSTVTLC